MSAEETVAAFVGCVDVSTLMGRMMVFRFKFFGSLHKFWGRQYSCRW